MDPSRRGSTLAQLVADTLRQALQDGLYLPGDRLHESIIAQEMSVSQNTARDAVYLLVGEGWLVRQPRQGTLVRSFSTEQAQELYALRRSLECMLIEWNLPGLGEGHKHHLAQLIGDARIHASGPDQRGVREAIHRFHESLLTLGDYPLTAEALLPLLNGARLLENLRARHDPDDTEALAERLTRYGDLLTHIRYSNVPASTATLANILDEECRTLLPVLDLVS